MSWEDFVPADVAAAAAAASPRRSEEPPAGGIGLRSPMPWMEFMPSSAQELAERMQVDAQVCVVVAPIWDLSGSSGTLHGPPEKKKHKPSAEAIQMSDRWRRKASRESVIFDLGNGCHCGCVYTLNIAAVLEMREEHMRQDQAERRAFNQTKPNQTKPTSKLLPTRYERSTRGPSRVHSCAAGKGRLGTRVGFCAAHDKSEPAREDASPPKGSPRHTRILWRHRIRVPRSNAERRSLARVPKPTPQGRLRPVIPPVRKKGSLEPPPLKRTVTTMYHNNSTTPRRAHHSTTAS